MCCFVRSKAAAGRGCAPASRREGVARVSSKGAVICRRRHPRQKWPKPPLESPSLPASGNGDVHPLTPDQRRACLPPHGLPSVRPFASRHPRPTVNRLDAAAALLTRQRRTGRGRCAPADDFVFAAIVRVFMHGPTLACTRCALPNRFAIAPVSASARHAASHVPVGTPKGFADGKVQAQTQHS